MLAACLLSCALDLFTLVSLFVIKNHLHFFNLTLFLVLHLLLLLHLDKSTRLKEKELCDKSHYDSPKTKIKEGSLYTDKEECNHDNEHEKHADHTDDLHLCESDTFRTLHQ
jgi:hypothetical protein